MRGATDPVDHHEATLQVAGPLNMPRCPQGRPALSGGIVRHRPPVCRAPRRGCVHRPYGEGDGPGILCRHQGTGGRRRPGGPDQVLILPGLSPLIADTEAEAQRQARELNDLTDPEVGAQAAVGPLRRARLLASAARQAAVAQGFPRPGHRSRRRAAAPR